MTRALTYTIAAALVLSLVGNLLQWRAARVAASQSPPQVGIAGEGPSPSERSQLPGSSASGPGASGANQLPDDAADQARSAELAKSMLAYLQAVRRSQAPELAKALGLDLVTVKRLIEIEGEVHAAMEDGTVTDFPETLDARLKAELGPEVARKYADYTRAKEGRELAQPAIAAFADADVQLTRTQREQLGAAYVTALDASDKRRKAAIASRGPDANDEEDFKSIALQNRRYHEEIFDAARSFLNPDQLAILSKQLRLDTEDQRNEAQAEVEATP